MCRSISWRVQGQDERLFEDDAKVASHMLKILPRYLNYVIISEFMYLMIIYIINSNCI